MAIDTPMAAASPGVAPVFRTQTSVVSEFGAQSLSFSNLQGSFSPGDYMLVGVAVRVSNGKNVTFATPPGWAVVAGPTRSPATGDGLRAYVFGRRFVSGDTAVTFTKSDNGNPTSSGAVIWGYSGVSSVTPFVASSGAANASSPATATGVSTTAINQKVIFVGAGYQNNTWSLPTAGWGTFTARAEAPSTTANPEIYVADATKATIGATGNISSTVTVPAGQPAMLASFLIALNP
jgi:hypothetical protein